MDESEFSFCLCMCQSSGNAVNTNQGECQGMIGSGTIDVDCNQMFMGNW